MGDSRQWFRVRPTYQKPAGGFLAIGPGILGARRVAWSVEVPPRCQGTRFGTHTPALD